MAYIYTSLGNNAHWNIEQEQSSNKPFTKVEILTILSQQNDNRLSWTKKSSWNSQYHQGASETSGNGRKSANISCSYLLNFQQFGSITSGVSPGIVFILIRFYVLSQFWQKAVGSGEQTFNGTRKRKMRENTEIHHNYSYKTNRARFLLADLLRTSQGLKDAGKGR